MTTIEEAEKLIASGEAEAVGTVTDDLGEVFGVLNIYDAMTTEHVLLHSVEEYRRWMDLSNRDN
jgi:hypothetical protein